MSRDRAAARRAGARYRYSREEAGYGAIAMRPAAVRPDADGIRMSRRHHPLLRLH